jgi:septum formation protein
VDFVVMPVNIDETAFRGEAPDLYVTRLAKEKTLIATKKDHRSLVLGADTTVADLKDVLGKPESQQHATEMLKRLRGREHQVYTALALWNEEKQSLSTNLCRTRVPMRNYSDDELEKYVKSGDPMDKAGAYAIQNAEFHPVEDFRGCFANVMGLPVCHLTRMLSECGLDLPGDIPVKCQQTLNYNCHIYPAILRGEDAG